MTKNKRERAAEDYLVASGAAFGISQATIHEYVVHYGLVTVSQQMANLLLAIQIGAEKNKPIRNPAGWLRSALAANYSDPLRRE